MLIDTTPEDYVEALEDLMSPEEYAKIVGMFSTVEIDMGASLGDPSKPLLLSVRSGAAVMTIIPSSVPPPSCFVSIVFVIVGLVQISMPGRLSSTIDVAANSLGAGLGALLGGWAPRRRGIHS